MSGGFRRSPLDRPRAWLVTGPLGRLAALAIEFGAALVRSARRRLGARREQAPRRRPDGDRL